MKLNSFSIRVEPCPKCRGVGNDKQGDNLAVYSDNHRYCFNCGYFISGNSVHSSTPRRNSTISLPGDVGTDYTQREMDWVRKYELNRMDLLRYNVLHSGKGIRFNYKGELKEVENVLIFPIFGQGLEGYIARTFLTPKWVSRGNINNVFNILPGNPPLILVEDIVSAIKINKVGHAVMPVYCSNVKNRFERLRKVGYKDITIWLDPNMHSSAISQCRYAVGLNTHIIFSSKDPKEHTYNEIRRYIDG